MEVAVSAISGEILTRLISFLIKKYADWAYLEDKLERLNHLLLRVHTVVEEAEGRYITNSHMLLQLQMIVDGLYRGYHVLSTFKFKPFVETLQEQVRNSGPCPLFCTASLMRTASGTMRSNKAVNRELQAALENLEAVASNMTEFIVLLGGCKKMPRRPYDTYLYIDNFMFSRLAEKQNIINFLLHDTSVGATAVLPVIGGYSVGKKSLVGYACNDNAVRSHFNSIFHLTSDNFLKMSHERFRYVRTLLVIEFFSNVDDSKWAKFNSAMSLLGTGSKVVIISRIEEIARFGTVRPIRLGLLSQAEFMYLFRVLSFGSTDPENHKQLASIGMELGGILHGLLLSGNVLADILRRNQNIPFWLHILKRFKRSIEHNCSNLGQHPKQLLERGLPTDITMLVSPSAAPLLMMPPRGQSSNFSMKELSKVTFADLLEGSASVVPTGRFQIIAWESRIPPFTKFVANCIEERHPCNLSDRKKRKRSFIT